MNPPKPKTEKLKRVAIYLLPRFVSRLKKLAKGGSVSAVAARIIEKECGS